MQPLVLVGGGLNHYELINSLSAEQIAERPIVLVSENHKLLQRRWLPHILSGKVSEKQAQLDLWSLAQKKSIYFIEDQCLHINRDEKKLQLKNFGKLNYHKLSVETQCQSVTTNLDKGDSSKLAFQNSSLFLAQMRQFFEEVQRHCPREVRVVILGWSRSSIELALSIVKGLKGGCEISDVLILEESELDQASFFASRDQKIMASLKKQGIRVIDQARLLEHGTHHLKLESGVELPYDVLIPWNKWQASDLIGRVLQGQQNLVSVTEGLSLTGDQSLFVSGDNVVVEQAGKTVNQYQRQEIVQVLKHNLFNCDEGEPTIKMRKRLVLDQGFDLKKDWSKLGLLELEALKNTECFEGAKIRHRSDLQYQAQHMTRPWGGGSHHSKRSPGTLALVSFHGFRSWGSYAQSALKIGEIAYLKSLSEGVEPERLRFNLTLPSGDPFLTQHIFESSFRAIEKVAERYDLQIDGGDTFDGSHWHLGLTLGGAVMQAKDQRLQPHDYLITTEPLGYGLLWAGSLEDRFDSDWIQQTWRRKSQMTSKDYWSFVERWQPSAEILIEEWGFLFHCLQYLPGNLQLMLNFREFPRWQGIDSAIKSKIELPGMEANWGRIAKEVSFSRDEVSPVNSILWDSLSQGSMVFAVKASEWRQALEHLHGLGYEQAALVGCTRPKSKGNRVVLSDWSPM